MYTGLCAQYAYIITQCLTFRTQQLPAPKQHHQKHTDADPLKIHSNAEHYKNGRPPVGACD